MVAALLTSLLYLSETRFSWALLAGLWLVGTVLNSLLWAVLTGWVKSVRRRFPAIGQTRWRVLATFGGYLFFITLEHLLLSKLVEISGVIPVPTDPVFYLKQSFIDLLWIVVLGVAFEVLYFLKKFRDTVQEAETVKKANLQNQYDRLKNRVNPHFLFNSLNSLTLLIEDNPRQAGEFLDELSSVYRYLLQNTDYQLAPLRSELRFVRSYFHLLKTRFGEAVDLQIQVSEEAELGQLPPLSLHLLIDNALNHNTTQPQQPLRLRIEALTPAFVDISNSVQRKTRRVATEARGGLSAVTSRFSDLNLPPPSVFDDGMTFTVRLPLAPRSASVMAGQPDANPLLKSQNPIHP